MIKKLIVAHRGASYLAKENTLEAFQRAIDLQADYIELDLRKTKDQILVAFHDEIICDRPLHELTYQEANDYAGTLGFKIPTIAQVIQLAQNQIKILVELKEEHYEFEIAELLCSNLSNKDFFIISFNSESLKVIKSSFPRIKVGLLLGQKNLQALLAEDQDLSNMTELTQQLGYQPDMILPNYDLLNTCHFFGNPIPISLFTWTVDDELNLLQLLKTDQVQGIITNRPELAISLQNQL